MASLLLDAIDHAQHQYRHQEPPPDRNSFSTMTFLCAVSKEFGIHINNEAVNNAVLRLHNMHPIVKPCPRKTEHWWQVNRKALLDATAENLIHGQDKATVR